MVDRPVLIVANAEQETHKTVPFNDIYAELRDAVLQCYHNIERNSKHHGTEFETLAKQLFIELCLEDGVEIKLRKWLGCCGSTP